MTHVRPVLNARPRMVSRTGVSLLVRRMRTSWKPIWIARHPLDEDRITESTLGRQRYGLRAAGSFLMLLANTSAARLLTVETSAASRGANRSHTARPVARPRGAHVT